MFFGRAVRIETEYGHCREEVNSITSAGLSLLRVGAGPVFHLNSIAKLFSELRSKFPEMQLELRTDKSVDNGIILRKDNPLAKSATIDAADLTGFSSVSFLSDQEIESRLLKYSVPLRKKG